MYEISIRTHFSAAHHLRDYDGKCAKQHGHNWLVEVYCRCEKLNEVGMGIDFVDLKREVNALLDRMDHSDLNEMEYFKEHNPTAERIAKYLFDRLSARFGDETASVSKVTVYETPNCAASYIPD